MSLYGFVKIYRVIAGKQKATVTLPNGRRKGYFCILCNSRVGLPSTKKFGKLLFRGLRNRSNIISDRLLAGNGRNDRNPTRPRWYLQKVRRTTDDKFVTWCYQLRSPCIRLESLVRFQRIFGWYRGVPDPTPMVSGGDRAGWASPSVVTKVIQQPSANMFASFEANSTSNFRVTDKSDPTSMRSALVGQSS